MRPRRIKSGVEREREKSSEFIQPVFCSAKIWCNKNFVVRTALKSLWKERRSVGEGIYVVFCTEGMRILCACMCVCVHARARACERVSA